MGFYSFNNKNKDLGEVLVAVNEGLAKDKQQYRQDAYDRLAEKRNGYLLDDGGYIKQLEKNIIYSAEGTLDLVRAMEKFKEEDYASLEDKPVDDVAQFVQSIPVIQAKERTKHHLNYLYGMCTECPYHDKHEEYGQLKKLRDAGDIKKYRDELEFNYVYHQTQNRIAKLYLLNFIKSSSRMAGLINTDEDIEQIKMNLHLITNFLLDNIMFEHEEKNG